MKNKEYHWFPHDKLAGANQKLGALIAEHGMAGYGRWWKLLEILRCQDGCKYSIKESFRYKMLGEHLKCSAAKAKQFIDDCINKYEVLCTDGEYIWSGYMMKYMKHWEQKRKTLSENGKKGAEITNLIHAANAAAGPQKNSGKDKDKDKDKIRDKDKEKINDKQEITTTIKQQFIDPQQAKEALLKDERFLYHYLGIKQCTQDQLSDWLDTFNKKLAITGDEQKTLHDYRTHFMNWFKFRDPVKENPKTFLQSSSNKAPTIIPAVTSYMKTAQQIMKEEEERISKLTGKAIGK